MIRSESLNRQRQLSRHWAITTLGSLLAAFLFLPILALFATSSVTELWSALRTSNAMPALRLSLKTTAISLVIVTTLGTPLAWMLAQNRTRLSRIIESCLQLPIVIPPAVAGIALLLSFGRYGLLTGRLYPDSWHITFTTTAVVLAETFVSAPFYVQAAVSAFRRIDPRLLVVAASFGAYPWRLFLHVAIPIASPGLIAGLAMSWARALGEFGATLMFAGNLEGTTQTLPLAIYAALELDMRAAQAISILLVLAALTVLLIVRSRWTQWWPWGEARRVN